MIAGRGEAGNSLRSEETHSFACSGRDIATERRAAFARKACRWCGVSFLTIGSARFALAFFHESNRFASPRSATVLLATTAATATSSSALNEASVAYAAAAASLSPSCWSTKAACAVSTPSSTSTSSSGRFSAPSDSLQARRATASLSRAALYSPDPMCAQARLYASSNCSASSPAASDAPYDVAAAESRESTSEASTFV
mmetsp:Transcript_32053/g.95338  ORF Transcript_32053/g.95338 Transcript_32053/m.95338 type:complete len:200 (+) Transcript_32053:420-1019(+)